MIDNQNTEKTKVVLASCLLLFMPISVLSFYFSDMETMYSFPFLDTGEKYSMVMWDVNNHVTHRLQWVLSLASDRVNSVIYIVCALINPNFKFRNFNMWYVFIFYESVRLIDLFLTFEQSPFVTIGAFLLVVNQVIYVIFYLEENR